jgi:tetratricopeptide (TPR) repeat protein
VWFPLGKSDKRRRNLRASAHYRSGLALFDHGRLQDAKYQFEKVIALDPDDVGALCGLGFCYYGMGERELALPLLIKSVTKNPNYAAAHYLLGQIYYDKGEFHEAVARFRSALATNVDPSQISSIHISLAVVHRDLGEIEEAIKEYLTALEYEPDREDLHGYVGGLYLEQGHFEQSLEHLEKANPEDSSIQQSLAWALWHVGERERAISTLQSAIESFPNDAQLHGLLGSLLFQARRFEEAVGVLEKTASLSGKPGDETYLLGSALREMGFLDRALEAYQRLLKRAPDDAETLMAIGSIYLEQDDLEKAFAFWKQAVKVKPEDAETRSTLAYGLYLKEDLKAALSEIDHAIVLDPDYEVAHQRKGLILNALGDKESAANELDKAISLGLTEALLDLAALYRESGDIGKARGCAERFIEEANKENPDAVVDLSKYLKEARAMLKELE